MLKNNMNILYAVNTKYIPQVGASICSVCENNTGFDGITFYVIGLDLSEKDKKHLVRLAKGYSRQLLTIEIENIENYFDFDYSVFGWNPIILARLLMGKLLPESVERVLYLDADTIVIGNLSGLWNRKLDGKTLAMCSEPTVNRKRKEMLGLMDYYYHNSGVLLVNLLKWRETGALDRILDYAYKNREKLFAIDQDAINGALKDEIAELLPKYNFSNIYTTYPYRFLRKLSKPQRYITKGLFDESRADPVIIHYLGEERPWRKGNTHKYRKEYKYYLSKTAWADTPDEEGWKLYFICWKLFNIVTKPFPAIRYKIIDSLIPAFINYRAKHRE